MRRMFWAQDARNVRRIFRHTCPIGQRFAVERKSVYTRQKLHTTSGTAGTCHVSVSIPTEDARTLVLAHGTLTSRASRGGHSLPGPPRDARDAPRTGGASRRTAVPNPTPAANLLVNLLPALEHRDEFGQAAFARLRFFRLRQP